MNGAMETKMNAMTIMIATMLCTLSASAPQYAFGVEPGRVYFRIWKRLGNQDSRSVVCFVNVKSGEIHRADSWKKAGRVLSQLPEVL